ncbi:non-specific serine/threonine protein kinase [Ranunculus cassubicifolius]
MATLEYLSLSKNSLTGVVPLQLTNMPRLETIDLSYNNLSGKIDCSICKMAYQVHKVDLSFNNFEGQDPHYLVNGNGEILFNARNALCAEFDLRLPCPKMHKHCEIVVICYILVAIFLVSSTLGIHYFRRKNQMEAARQIEAEQTKDKDILSIWNYDGKIVYEDIIRATEDFDLKYCIGVGGYGSVYKAKLSSGKLVALKKLHKWESHIQAYEGSFKNEIKFLTAIRHRNIVKLYGFCSSPQCMFLIYEYMERGSLFCCLSNETEIYQAK